MAGALVVLVVLLSFGRRQSDVPVVPDTATPFSLDMDVVATADGAPVYAVEQRARPAYRIFEFDPATGTDTTVFTVPEDAIIYGIALSPDRATLAVSYTSDYHLGGNGLSLLDLDTLELTEVAPTQAGVFMTDPEWAAAGDAVFVTHVDRRTGDEQLAIASIDLADGDVQLVIENAIDPTVIGDDLYHLVVDAENARRSIGRMAPDGSTDVLAVGDGSFDLDHLTPGTETAALRVAVIEPVPDDAAITVGTPASAHGNHNVASEWWQVEGPDAAPTTIEPIIVYDASSTAEGAIVYATLEGLALADDARIDLIESRAIRFVAG